MSRLVQEEFRRVREMELQFERELPKPYFIFVKSYGQTLEESMQEIAHSLGKEDGFVFFTNRFKEEELCEKLDLEKQKRTLLGKTYNGCVLVNLPEELKEKNVLKLINYFAEEGKNILPIFEVGTLEEVETLKQQLEQYFYVRIMEGTMYSAQDQVWILTSIRCRGGENMQRKFIFLDEMEVKREQNKKEILRFETLGRLREEGPLIQD